MPHLSKIRNSYTDKNGRVFYRLKNHKIITRARYNYIKTFDKSFKGLVIHHINFDVTDDSIDNLIALKPNLHTLIHKQFDGE